MDGFGCGWFNLEIDPEPAIFTSVTPPMHNINLHRMAPKILSDLIFAHVRAASPSSPIVETNTHPFSFGKYLWMHNGGIANFTALKRQLAMRLSTHIYNLIKGTTDSEFGAFAI